MCFCAGFDEEWKVMEKCDRTRQVKTQCGKRGNSARPVHSNSSWEGVSSLLEIKMIVSSVYRDGISHRKVLGPASGEGQRVPPVPVFSNSFSLKY